MMGNSYGYLYFFGQINFGTVNFKKIWIRWNKPDILNSKKLISYVFIIFTGRLRLRGAFSLLLLEDLFNQRMWLV